MSQTTQIQFTSSQRPYQPRVPRSIQLGSKNDFTARPSSMIPYAAPRRRMLGQPVFHRTAVSRITRTPAPYNQMRNNAAMGFSHSMGGEDPDSISAMTGERRMSPSRGRRFGWVAAPAMETTSGGRIIKAAGTMLPNPRRQPYSRLIFRSRTGACHGGGSRGERAKSRGDRSRQMPRGSRRQRLPRIEHTGREAAHRTRRPG